ncbi:hypothetical protein LOTGIDRAFT_163773 [Lottia gigantea]|uniref:DDE-1 domain-containing protein n=1 Tax=Lottia gigantea TaxID=225164 RepID=V4A7B6_LOTGI|nr:hypothetical protein LOTGIDRAFT_163773 [Lottia gigantea]ESO90885.1 hypothetical protein LOTGIDRAFT_163773 [Lottia gigantea]
MASRRIAYTTKEKLNVIAFAEAHRNRAAGREFNINESNIRSWRSKRGSLLKMPKTKCALRGRKTFFPEVEAEKNNISQKLSSDHEEKLMEFKKFIIKQRKKNGFDLSQIGNANQTPMTFDLPSASTITTKGDKTVHLRTRTGNEKNRFTLMLACTADGGKLPPYVIFCQNWLKTVWGKRPGAAPKKKSLLVLDACHRSSGVKDLLKEELTTELAIIPSGLTSILQPLYVSINKPMKVAVRKMWAEWMAGGEHTYTKAGARRKVELDIMCEWIVKAWKELDAEIIINTCAVIYFHKYRKVTSEPSSITTEKFLFK